jgi:hypothetical protein
MNWDSSQEPGDFWYMGEGESEAFAWLCVACKEVHAVSCSRWNFDGDYDHPTLTPSIQMLAQTCKWHGFVTKGVFSTC